MRTLVVLQPARSPDTREGSLSLSSTLVVLLPRAQVLENLILSQLDLSAYGPAFLDPDFELEHVFD